MPHYLFRGEPAPFAEVYPEVKSIRIEFDQDKSQYWTRGKERGQEIYTESTLRAHIACRNPLCRRGGFDLDSTLSWLIPAKETSYEWSGVCNGDEGSPKGRRKGPWCMNPMAIKIAVEYK